MTTIQNIRNFVVSQGLAMLDIDLLLQHTLHITRENLFRNLHVSLTNEQETIFLSYVKRCLAGEPLAYIIGEKEFWSLMLTVNKDVLVPRPETELLVTTVLANIMETEDIQILELGTGSGAISIALQKERPHWHLTATDISSAALLIAKKNASRHGVTINFLESNWFYSLNNNKFNCIVSNPPYLSSQDPHLNTEISFEPQSALVAGHTGLECLETIVKTSVNYLLPSGCIVLEHGYNQQQAVHKLLVKNNFVNIQVLFDYAAVSRVAVGWML